MQLNVGECLQQSIKDELLSQGKRDNDNELWGGELDVILVTS